MTTGPWFEAFETCLTTTGAIQGFAVGSRTNSYTKNYQTRKSWKGKYRTSGQAKASSVTGLGLVRKTKLRPDEVEGPIRLLRGIQVQGIT